MRTALVGRVLTAVAGYYYDGGGDDDDLLTKQTAGPDRTSTSTDVNYSTPESR